MGRVVSRWIAFLVVAGLGRVASAGSAPASPGGLPPLIPREVLFGNPERVQPKLSPDSKRLAWLAPDKNGVRDAGRGEPGRPVGRRVLHRQILRSQRFDPFACPLRLYCQRISAAFRPSVKNPIHPVALT